MNCTLTGRLILKDWYLQRWLIALALFGGLGSLGIVCLGGQVAFMIGLILFVTALVATGAQLPVASIVNERKEQTLPFVITLPISYKEYTVSKLIGTLSIFFILWAFLVGCVGLLFALPHGIPRGMFPFTAIMAAELLLSNCFITTVALVTESQKWTVTAVMIANVAFSLIGFGILQLPGIYNGFHGTTVMWSSTATLLVFTEVVLLLVLLGSCLFFQSRKKDFL